MTYIEILREARAHEKAGRWAAASDAWRRAANLYAMMNHDVREGDELRHTKRGAVRATCVYRGPSAIEYRGKVYGSLSAAAKAAAAVLGLNVAGVTGRVFWGLAKRESPTFTEAAR